MRCVCPLFRRLVFLSRINQVIAFLTSDIQRNEAGGVTRDGHKEGYLTKRGKNFGGWKSRYFVCDGPVLEYYESRGGAHLGTIQITGAQIGRQQKADIGNGADGEAFSLTRVV